MNRRIARKIFVVLAVVLIGFFPALSQKAFKPKQALKEEVRVFDFTDGYYSSHGVLPDQIWNRHIGKWPSSVFDYSWDPRHSNVRILETFPAYDQHGRMIFWNLYGELYLTSFTLDKTGEIALGTANRYPIYIFPSQTSEFAYRQAHLINLRRTYFDDNDIGLGVQVIVEYTDQVNTEKGKLELAALGEKNGYSFDGTPIIKTELEIEDLSLKELVKLRIKGYEWGTDPSFAIGLVIRDPRMGAITPDAYLVNVGRVAAETKFQTEFDCLQTMGRWCDEK
jgi:hypothetical protein